MNGRKSAHFRLFRVALCGATLLISTQTLAAATVNPVTAKDAAANRKRARVLFDQAEEAFSHDEFKKALSLFQQAQEAAFNEALDFNIAVCLERLDRVGEALQVYRRVQASFTLHASTKDRALAAISRLQPPSPLEPVGEPEPKPVPLPAPPEISPATVVVALPPQKEPLPTLRHWGWVGAGGAALGLGAATTVLILGKGNQSDYDNAVDLQQAQTFYDRADNYDTAFKLSLALALTGLATVAIDRLWRD